MRLCQGGLFVKITLFLVKRLNVLVLLFIPAPRPRENESSYLSFYVNMPTFSSEFFLKDLALVPSAVCYCKGPDRPWPWGTGLNEEPQTVD